MRSRRVLIPALLLSLAATLGAQSASKGGVNSIEPAPLREWLTYLASDDLQGRQVYTEGLGLAAAYIAGHLKEWGVKPAGDNGSYFQTVKIVGVRTTSRASVTVEVDGQSRTFKDGEGVTFPRNMGGKQTITSDQVLFAGYGLQVPAASIDDYANVDPSKKIVIWLGSDGPASVGPESRRLLAARSRTAIDKGASAVLAAGFGSGPSRGAPPAGAGRGQPGGGRGGQADPVDFTTAQRYDQPTAPALTAQDELLEFLFSGSATKYADLKAAAAKREPLAPFTLANVKMTIGVDADYAVANTRLTRNVAGIVHGTDQRVKDTYVLFSAHYDHVGYSQATPGAGRGGGAATNPGGCTGQTRDTPRPGDVINNGADDDGSGSVAVMALARAFALGPKPKRSAMFVWHSGEESGLQGSRYMADYPSVPIEKMAAVLNIDMIGRNRCDQASEAKTVYLVGSDRISTELHNISEDANAALPTPLTLDYELNDPADPESIYTRSDHYSYAVKGIPIVFYTTGLHRDYHYVTDEVDRIEFPKLALITRLVYQTGWSVANLDHLPVRDNKGPRRGKGVGGKIVREP